MTKLSPFRASPFFFLVRELTRWYKHIALNLTSKLQSIRAFARPKLRQHGVALAPNNEAASGSWFTNMRSNNSLSISQLPLKTHMVSAEWSLCLADCRIDRPHSASMWVPIFGSTKLPSPGDSKWPFWDGEVTLFLVKWPPTRWSKGHFESPGNGFVKVFCILLALNWGILMQKLHNFSGTTKNSFSHCIATSPPKKT